MRESLIQWIEHFYQITVKGRTIIDQEALNDDAIYWTLGLIGVLIISSYILWMLTKSILLSVLHGLAKKSKATWDDHLMNNRVFRGAALLVPLMFMEYFLSIAFFHYPNFLIYSDKLVTILMLFTITVIVNRFFNGVRDIITSIDIYKDKPIQSYSQVLKIIFSGIMIIIILSILTDRSPVFFLTSLGAVSAILLLVFRDSILGFVGSIQLSTNDMIRIGDWVTMEKYGADGDVEEINLTTVKVRNFDKTITTIPTYSFISDSFINWRGMIESDGRRIKRSLNIHIDSVKFANESLISTLSKIDILNEFIQKRQEEIRAYNEENGFVNEKAVFGRKQTNLGLFRRYIEFYLAHKNEINSEMTLIVRQLPSNDKGIPLELYCFTITKNWQEYEEILADIFDHIFAVIHVFELNVFESPSGRDVKKLKG